MRTLPLIVTLLFAAPAHAQSTLTLDQALCRAQKSNRDLRILRAQLDEQSVALEQARVALLPQISAQARYTHNNRAITLPLSAQTQLVIQRSEQLDAALNVTVPLLAPAAYPALSAARHTVRSAENGFAASQTGVLNAMAQAFFLSAGADELVIARQHAVEVARRTLDDARAKVAAGAVHSIEQSRAELALMSAEQASRDAQDAAAQAHSALATILDLREPFVVAWDLPPAAEANVDELVRRAIGARPELQQLKETLAGARAQHTAQSWRWAPTLSAFGGLRAFNYTGFSGDHYAWSAGLQLDWQLYDGGARDAARHLALAQGREDDARLALTGDQIVDEVTQAARVRASKQTALATALRAITLSQETLRVIRTQHDEGAATQLELLQAQDGLVAADVGRAQARFDLALAEIGLDRAVGAFPACR